MSARHPSLRVVSEQELRGCITEREALQAVEIAFTALAEGRVEQPAPMGFDFPDVDGEVHVKGAAIRNASVFAVKLASGFYRNPAANLPLSSGLVMVMDQTTGFPLAIFHDNAFLTEMRTAGAGALAARLLGPDKIKKLAMIGTGAQARYQLRAITNVCAVEAVSAWSRSSDNRTRYADEMRDTLDVAVEPCERIEDALSDASVVVTVTPSREPLVFQAAVSPSATIIAVGSDGDSKQELDAELVAAAGKVVVDRLTQCERLGELHHAIDRGLMSRDDIHGELGDVLVGKRAGREADELIVCDLTGVGAQDAAIADVAWQAIGSR